MPEYTLTALSALNGYKETFDGVALVELTDLAVVSIATPQGGEDALLKAVENNYGVTVPQPGKANLSKDGSTRFLGMSPDQMFAIFDHAKPDAVDVVAEKLKDTGYYTLQSDNWVGLRISGPKCLDALERISPIDLSPAAFPVGSVARTSMEHMGVIVYPEDADSFVLISASSSAASFLHAVVTSINNVL